MVPRPDDVDGAKPDALGRGCGGFDAEPFPDEGCRLREYGGERPGDEWGQGQSDITARLATKAPIPPPDWETSIDSCNRYRADTMAVICDGETEILRPNRLAWRITIATAHRRAIGPITAIRTL